MDIDQLTPEQRRQVAKAIGLAEARAEWEARDALVVAQAALDAAEAARKQAQEVFDLAVVAARPPLDKATDHLQQAQAAVDSATAAHQAAKAAQAAADAKG